jgi:hypothetical protein
MYNELVAPGFCEFSAADVPNLLPEFDDSPSWLGNHFVSSLLGSRFDHGMRQLVLGYLRRASGALATYKRAGNLTRTFLQERGEGRTPVAQYYAAVNAWEEFVLHLTMALDLLRHINAGKGLFQKNDGSPEQRLYTLANHIKHIDSCIASGQCTETDTLPLWLSNEGLESFGITVTYGESAAVLTNIALLADSLQDRPLASGTTSMSPLRFGAMHEGSS